MGPSTTSVAGFTCAFTGSTGSEGQRNLPRASPWRGSSDLLGRQKAANRVAGLSTARQPILHALGVQLNGGGLFERVVRSDHLNRPAITGFALVEHDNAVKRLFLLAKSSQADCQHSLPPSQGL